MSKSIHPLLEVSPYDADAGNLIGRDPREISAEDFASHLHDARTGLSAIRAKCLDCCGGFSSEVRKCVQHDCPLWPLRMGSKPRGMAEARGEKERKVSEASMVALAKARERAS